MPIYRPFLIRSINGTIDIDSDTFKVALLTAAYTPSIQHGVFAEVSGYELPTGSGYAAGGATVTLSQSMLGWERSILSTNPTWSSLTATFRYAVLYDTITRNHVPKPLVAYFDLGTVTVTNENWTLRFNPARILLIDTS